MSVNECITSMYPKTSLKDLINDHYGVPYGIPDEDVQRYCENDVIVTREMVLNSLKLKEENKMNHKITLIGSMKNKDAMMEIYNKLTLRGNLVMLPYMGDIPEDADDYMIEQLHDIHREKMRVADFVVVVDQNGYIGKDTQAGIKWCESQGKRIIYASDFAMLDAPAKSKK